MSVPSDREDIHVTLGRNVKRRRTKLGITIRDLAAQLGWSPARVTEIEQARKGASLDRVQVLADALDCSVASLFRVAP